MQSHSQLLLIGWQGTLRPAAHQPSATDQEQAANRLRPWLDEAIKRLQDEAPQGSRLWSGQLVPIEQLLPPLIDRLMGIAAAAALSKSGGPPLKVDPAQALRQAPYSTHAARSVQQWATATAIFLQRLQADKQSLSHWTGKSRLPTITSLSAANSDIHDSAGITIRIDFSDGRGIFYKPRSMTGELLWYELTRKTAKANPECAVTAAQVLLGGENRYGWMQALAPIKPSHKNEPLSYWRSAGSLLCQAWIAAMTDLHMANILATPTGPAVVDAECLATPQPDPQAEDDPVISLSTQLAATGLLPSSGLPNISGFFGQAQTVANLQLPVWTFPDCHPPKLSLSAAQLIDQQNRYGESRPISCVPAIADGFLQAAQALLDVRDELLQRGGWLDQLANQHAPRIILRDTLQYGLSLTRTLLAARTFPPKPANNLASIADAERLAIEHLQIPRFFLPAGSRNLATNSTGIVAQDFAKAPVSQSIRSRLEVLSTANLRENLTPALLFLMLREAAPSPPKHLKDCGNI